MLVSWSMKNVSTATESLLVLRINTGIMGKSKQFFFMSWMTHTKQMLANFTLYVFKSIHRNGKLYFES
jgi:hypothetical protein